MKPTFALDLSRDQIALLHRTPKGWLTIGEVAFDAPDMAQELDYLRKTALGLSPLGLASKVILPNAQILYTEVHAPGPSREDKRRQIAQALQGRTPYAVEDLVFDWSGKGSVVRVAVVARETLDEAEGFAVANRLNPVSFVAIPEDGTFVGEAWFGPTNSADTFLAPGETVERDREAVSIIPLAQPSPEPVQNSADPAEDGVDSLPGLEEALTADVTDADLAAVSAGRNDMPEVESFDPVEPLAEDPVVEPDPDREPPVADSNEMVTLEAEVEPVPDLPLGVAPEPESTKAFWAAPEEPPMVGPLEPVSETVVQATNDGDEAPFADVPDEGEAAEVVKPQPPAGDARVLAPDILDDDLPPAPSSAAMFAFSSRRSASPGARPEATGRVVPPVTAGQGPAAAQRPGLAGDAVPGPIAARPYSAAVTAPSIPGTRPKPKLKPTTSDIPRPVAPAKMPAPVTVKPLTRPNGTFGAPPPKRARTGFVFMVLIALLLLCLALVAGWATFFLNQAESDVQALAPTDSVEVPAVEDEMAADLQDPEEFAAAEGAEAGLAEDPAAAPTGGAAADLEALATEEMPVNLGGDDSGVPPVESVAETLDATALPGDPAAGTEAETAGAEAGTGEAAPGTTIATDVAGSRTPVEDQDEIFLAAMDAPPPILDALALPTPAASADAPPAAPMLPPAPGTVYQFDAQGLLVPTTDGILSPDGVMLFAGPPPLVPPTRSVAAESAAAAVAPVAPPDTNTTTTTAADASLVTAGETAASLPEGAVEAPVEVVPSDPAMAGFRPKPRPEGLVVPDDGASLDTGTGVDVVSLRPLPRPTSVTAAAAAADPGTAVADLGAQGASLTAQAEAMRAEAEALEAANPSIVAISMRPAARPSDLSRAVEAAVAAAVREPDPVAEAEVELAAAAPADDGAVDEPEPEAAAPSIPTKASVAKQATYDNAINLSKINLIGTFGTSSKPYALIRQANGKYKKVKVGDKIDGGVVKAITENEVRYQKGGKLVSLKMPKA